MPEEVTNEREREPARAQGEIDLSVGVGALLEAGLTSAEIHTLVDQTIEIASKAHDEFEVWSEAKSFTS